MASLLYAMFISAQGWIWQDIYEDSKESEPLTIISIIYAAIFFAAIYGLYKYSKYLKRQSLSKYKRIVTKSIVIYGLTFFIGLIAVSVMNSIRKSKIENEEHEVFENIVNKTDYYLDFNANLNSFVEVKKLGNKEFGYALDEINTLFAKYDLNNDTQPFNGVYSVYQVIRTPGIEMLIANATKDFKVGLQKHPFLIGCRIEPYQIRYFSPNANPESDVMQAYIDYAKKFVRDHKCIVIDEMYPKIRKQISNDFFTMETERGGTEIWNNKKKLNDDENPYLCGFEYETVNYGNFEIMYWVQHTDIVKYGFNFDLSEGFSKKPKFVIDKKN